MKKRFPDFKIEINGGITDLQQCQSHLHKLDGVMIGRAAYENPWILSKVDSSNFQLQRSLRFSRKINRRPTPIL